MYFAIFLALSISLYSCKASEIYTFLTSTPCIDGLIPPPCNSHTPSLELCDPDLIHTEFNLIQLEQLIKNKEQIHTVLENIQRHIHKTPSGATIQTPANTLVRLYNSLACPRVAAHVTLIQSVAELYAFTISTPELNLDILAKVQDIYPQAHRYTLVSEKIKDLRLHTMLTYILQQVMRKHNIPEESLLLPIINHFKISLDDAQIALSQAHSHLSRAHSNLTQELCDISISCERTLNLLSHIEMARAIGPSQPEVNIYAPPTLRFNYNILNKILKNPSQKLEFVQKVHEHIYYVPPPALSLSNILMRAHHNLPKHNKGSNSRLIQSVAELCSFIMLSNPPLYLELFQKVHSTYLFNDKSKGDNIMRKKVQDLRVKFKLTYALQLMINAHPSPSAESLSATLERFALNDNDAQKALSQTQEWVLPLTSKGEFSLCYINSHCLSTLYTLQNIEENPAPDSHFLSAERSDNLEISMPKPISLTCPAPVGTSTHCIEKRECISPPPNALRPQHTSLNLEAHPPTNNPITPNPLSARSLKKLLPSKLFLRHLNEVFQNPLSIKDIVPNILSLIYPPPQEHLSLTSMLSSVLDKIHSGPQSYGIHVIMEAYSFIMSPLSLSAPILQAVQRRYPHKQDFESHQSLPYQKVRHIRKQMQLTYALQTLITNLKHDHPLPTNILEHFDLNPQNCIKALERANDLCQGVIEHKSLSQPLQTTPELKMCTTPTLSHGKRLALFHSAESYASALNQTNTHLTTLFSKVRLSSHDESESEPITLRSPLDIALSLEQQKTFVPSEDRTHTSQQKSIELADHPHPGKDTINPEHVVNLHALLTPQFFMASIDRITTNPGSIQQTFTNIFAPVYLPLPHASPLTNMLASIIHSFTPFSKFSTQIYGIHTIMELYSFMLSPLPLSLDLLQAVKAHYPHSYNPESHINTAFQQLQLTRTQIKLTYALQVLMQNTKSDFPMSESYLIHFNLDRINVKNALERTYSLCSGLIMHESLPLELKQTYAFNLCGTNLTPSRILYFFREAENSSLSETLITNNTPSPPHNTVLDKETETLTPSCSGMIASPEIAFPNISECIETSLHSMLLALSQTDTTSFLNTPPAITSEPDLEIEYHRKRQRDPETQFDEEREVCAQHTKRPCPTTPRSEPSSP